MEDSAFALRPRVRLTPFPNRLGLPAFKVLGASYAVSRALSERYGADGRALPGFEAYRYVVPRVPGLWWLVPFFYLPVISRLLGHRIYNWVAANRSRLSAMRFGVSRPQAR